MAAVDQENLQPGEEQAREEVLPSRFRRMVSQFCESPVAVVALVVLAFIAATSFMAPVVAPQNPYDLSEIDISDARLPPGSMKMSELSSTGVRVILERGATETEVLVDPIDREDFVSADYLNVQAAEVPAPDGSRAFRLEIVGAEDGPLDPIVSGQISNLPQNAELSAGERPRFGNIWRMQGGDFKDLILTVPEGTGAITLRVNVAGGAQEPVMTYWLGTDDQGRDMLSAIIYGLRISMIVALSSVFIALAIGTFLGIYAAFKGGWIGAFIMRVVDLQMSFPTILVALILLAFLGPGVINVLLALVIVQWALYARVARSVALSELNKEYVEAARSVGFRTGRILFVHILPNCSPSLIVIATLEVAHAIALEATLSFLGLGLPITQPSLGLLVSNGFQYLLSGYPWISILPGVAILIAVLAINLVGDELRDILNPRLNQ